MMQIPRILIFPFRKRTKIKHARKPLIIIPGQMNIRPEAHNARIRQGRFYRRTIALVFPRTLS